MDDIGRNLEKDALQMAETRQRILEEGFRIFAENTIEKVKMTDVARAAGIGVATLYRYYGTKTDLVLGISTWIWKAYYEKTLAVFQMTREGAATAAEELEFYLDAFLTLYREHKDILRFNQFFNIYVQSEDVAPEQMQSYDDIIDLLAARFHQTYTLAEKDGTLQTDISERVMFSSMVHLMLAVVTRYAVGLAYMDDADPDRELLLMKELLMRTFVRTA